MDKEKLRILHHIELLIWLIVLLFVLAFVKYSYHSSTHNSNVYNIFMPDVDGLIEGSSVRMMGIEVGHVIKIKPTNDEVFVKFIIQDKDIKLPHGTVATVEFSGMAGSKSLELYLPDKTTYIDKDTPILSVERPKRLHDAAALLNDMFKKITSIIYTSSYFSKKVKEIEMPEQLKGEKADFEEFIKYTDKILDDSIQRAENFNLKLNKKDKHYGK